jgi:hypothetical protein
VDHGIRLNELFGEEIGVENRAYNQFDTVEAFQILPTARGQVVDHDHSLDGWFYR